MAAENFLIDDRGNWKTIEAIGEGFPQFNVVSSFAFVKKSCLNEQTKYVDASNRLILSIIKSLTINSVDAGTFVVAAQ